MASKFSSEKYLFSFLLLTIVFWSKFLKCEETSNVKGVWPASTIAPSVMVAFFVRNKAHTLPWFLNHLEKLDYPKERMKLWIRSDHNVDNSVPILRQWLGHVQHQYNSVDFVNDNSETSYSDAEGPHDWSKKRVKNILRLRQDALNAARNSWADYLLFVDCDNFLLYNETLKILIQHGKPIIAPLLNVTASEYYSNFWGDMGEDGYYKRSPDYGEIKNREKMGVFRVPVVHSTFLIEIRDPLTNTLAYDPPPMGHNGPIDDIILFALSAKNGGVPMFISNEFNYGLMLLPMDSENTIDQEKEQFVHMKMECVVFDVPLEKLPYIDVPARIPEKLGFDEIYLINLVRRPDRKDKMVACFKELGLNVTIIDAIDGKLMNQSYLKNLNVKVASSYADPFHGTRTMTLGEIGCFLSHYFIWLDVLAKQYTKILILEDDVRFHIYFKEKMEVVMEELKEMALAWDLMYVGRKKLYEEQEPKVGQSTNLVWPFYSYWTIGYALTYSGAWKLVQEEPLKKIVPVDEYIPIMFDRHPREDWKAHFKTRNLVAVSSNPLLIEPTLYTGEPGYFTDTEDSITLDELIPNKASRRGDTGPVPTLNGHGIEL